MTVHERDLVLSWFPVQPDRGGNRVLEFRRNPRQMRHGVGCMYPMVSMLAPENEE